MPDAFEVTIEAQGRVIKQAVRLKAGFQEDQPASGPCPSKRGEIKEFSPRSRKRLLDMLNRMDPGVFDLGGETVKFLTLTYGVIWPDCETAKRHLRAFLEVIRRRWPGASGVWRLEYQKRGAPHYHLVLFGVPFVWFTVLRGWWERIISWDPSVENNEHVFVRIEEIKSYKALTCYVSKYCAKMAEKEPDGSLLDSVPYLHEGRWWGIFNKSMLPWGKIEIMKITFGKWFFETRRAARKIYKRLRTMKNRLVGYTLYLNQPEKFKNLLIDNYMEGSYEYSAAF